MTLGFQWRYFFIFGVSVFWILGAWATSSTWSRNKSPFDKMLMDIELKDEYKNNEIQFAVSPTISYSDDWSLNKETTQIRVHISTKNDPIKGEGKDKILKKLKDFNGGKDWTWECTIHFKNPEYSNTNLKISENDKNALKRFFKQITSETNISDGKLDSRKNKWNMIRECAKTRPEENKRIRKEKTLKNETLNANLRFVLKKEGEKLIFKDKELFEDVFCSVYLKKIESWKNTKYEREVDC